MKQNINFSQFCDAFKDHERENQFSYEGKRALFDYLENYEEETGTELNLDVVAFCCEYTEYENIEELKNSYPKIETIEELEDHTQVIKIEGTDKFIIQNY